MPRPDPNARTANIVTDLVDDGLPCPLVKEHTPDKHRMLGYYLDIVANAMSERFENLFYLDLYAGAGRNRVERTGEIIEGSPLIACRTVPHFKKHILCEADPELAAALKRRIERDFSFVSYRVFPKSCDDAIAEIRRELPTSFRGLLVQCFVDPCAVNIRLRTIRALSDLKIDFVVLVADRMAAHRNAHNYVAPGNSTIEHLLDAPDWRADWVIAEKDGVGFDHFVNERFSQAMHAMGFLSAVPERFKVTNKGVLLYRLMLFSRNQRAIEFWKDTSKYARDQGKLFL